VRIFIVAGQIIDHVNNYHGDHVSPDKVFINPEIIKASKVKKSMRGEGCLSVRFTYGTTKRFDKATVKALDEQGKEFIMDGSGLLAQIFQHEIDHLNGILFIDHAHDIREMSDDEKKTYQVELNRLREERMSQ
jgi:peptide deformylase